MANTIPPETEPAYIVSETPMLTPSGQKVLIPDINVKAALAEGFKIDAEEQALRKAQAVVPEKPEIPLAVVPETEPENVKYAYTNEKGETAFLTPSGKQVWIPKENAQAAVEEGFKPIEFSEFQARQEQMIIRAGGPVPHALGYAATSFLPGFRSLATLQDPTIARTFGRIEEEFPVATKVGDIGGTAASLLFGPLGIIGRGAGAGAGAIAAKVAPRTVKAATWVGRIGAESAVIGFDQEAQRAAIEQRPFDWGNAAKNTGIMMGAAGALGIAGRGIVAAGRKIAPRISPITQKIFNKVLADERKIYNATKEIADNDAQLGPWKEASNPIVNSFKKAIEERTYTPRETAVPLEGKDALNAIRKDIAWYKKNPPTEMVEAGEPEAAQNLSTELDDVLKRISLEELKLKTETAQTSLAADLAKNVIGRQLLGGLAGYSYTGGPWGALLGAAMGQLTKNPDIRMLTYSLFRGAYESTKTGKLGQILDVTKNVLKPPLATLANTDVGGAVTMKILTTDEMKEIGDELQATTPAAVYKQQFGGLVSGGMDTRAAADIAAFRAKGVEFLKNNFPTDKENMAARIKFSKTANAIMNLPLALQRIDNMTASNEDIEVAKTMLGEVGFRQIQHQAEIRLKSDKKLTQKEKMFLNRLLGEQTRQGVLTNMIQQSYQGQEQGKSQFNPEPVGTPMQGLQKGVGQ